MVLGSLGGPCGANDLTFASQFTCFFLACFSMHNFMVFLRTRVPKGGPGAVFGLHRRGKFAYTCFLKSPSRNTFLRDVCFIMELFGEALASPGVIFCICLRIVFAVCVFFCRPYEFGSGRRQRRRPAEGGVGERA